MISLKAYPPHRSLESDAHSKAETTEENMLLYMCSELCTASGSDAIALAAELSTSAVSSLLLAKTSHKW